MGHSSIMAQAEARVQHLQIDADVRCPGRQDRGQVEVFRFWPLTCVTYMLQYEGQVSSGQEPQETAMNLVGKTHDETYRNVLAQVAERGWTIEQDVVVDEAHPDYSVRVARRMVINNGTQTVRMMLMADGRVVRQINNN